MSKAANSEAENISSHFSQFLRPVISDDEEHAKNSFRVRHHVYCEELKFEDEKPDGLEKDGFDEHSLHCLIEHKSSGHYAGTVRLITSNNDQEKLPIELYCSEAIEREDLFPSNFDRNNICEISRLAVPAEFRRRQMDQHPGAATGVINRKTYSETELRCFPFIAVGLYLSACSILLRMKIDNCFVMVEPRLARSMRFVGLKFEQIGPVIDYHGKRAPFYIKPSDVPGALRPGFRALLENIDHEIGEQL